MTTQLPEREAGPAAAQPRTEGHVRGSARGTVAAGSGRELGRSARGAEHRRRAQGPPPALEAAAAARAPDSRARLTHAHAHARVHTRTCTFPLTPSLPLIHSPSFFRSE